MVCSRTFATLLLALTLACAGGETQTGDTQSSQPARVDSGLFADVTAEVGLAADDGTWPDGTFNLVEIMQGGVGLFDYDADGDLDLFHARVPPPGQGDQPAPDRLYRQEEDGRFVDVTDASGIVSQGWAQGLAVGDIDNDGDEDLLVTNYGEDQLFVNQGDGTFAEATERAGLTGDRWSTSATFCDYDADGFLDLYVVHYLKYDADTNCLNDRDQKEYCGPQVFRGEPDILFRNRGNGTFENVTAKAGIRLPDGGSRAKGLGVVCSDMTGDGLPDFFIANDGEANQLWVNRGDGTFSEQGIMRGVAVNRDGVPEASMGIAIGDIDADGATDLFMTHLRNEHNRLFTQKNKAMFSDGSIESRLTMSDLEWTGFGCGFFDFDSDGDLDLAVANGSVTRPPDADNREDAAFWDNFSEPNQLFENDGTGTFRERLDTQFEFENEVSRGLAFGDVDNDGDVDFVVSNVDNTLRMYRNESKGDSHWLLVSLVERGRHAVGASAVLESGGQQSVRWVTPGYSYLSSNDSRLHFGLGDATAVDSLTVSWSDGARERFAIDSVDQEVVLVRGEGERL